MLEKIFDNNTIKMSTDGKLFEPALTNLSIVSIKASVTNVHKTELKIIPTIVECHSRIRHTEDCLYFI